jgi:hypothetical protein
VLRYAYINTRHRVVEDLLQLGAPFSWRYEFATSGV